MFVKEKNKFFIIVLILIFGCSKESSITNYQDVYIYTSDNDKDIVLKVLNDYLFDFTYNTPKSEKKYRPILKSPTDFMNNPKHSILILASIEGKKDTTIDLIANHLLDGKIGLVNNYYVEDQLLFILKYNNEEDLIAGIQEQKEWVLSKIKENEFEKLSKYSFKSGLNEELILRAREMFGININIQKDYKEISSNDDSHFLWMGRAFPYRWIVLYEDIQHFYQTPKSSWERLENKFNEHLNVDVISYKPQFEIVNFENEEIRKIYGVYGTKIDSRNPTGGPFITYILDQDETNRVLIVSGFVNFPGKDKIFHIKELEYILETITKEKVK